MIARQRSWAAWMSLNAMASPAAREPGMTVTLTTSIGPGATNIARAADGTRLFSHYVAPHVYAAAGITAADVDVALLYDAYSSLVLAQLEDFGFCARGDGTPRRSWWRPIRLSAACWRGPMPRW